MQRDVNGHPMACYWLKNIFIIRIENLIYKFDHLYFESDLSYEILLQYITADGQKFIPWKTSHVFFQIGDPDIISLPLPNFVGTLDLNDLNIVGIVIGSLCGVAVIGTILNFHAFDLDFTITSIYDLFFKKPLRCKTFPRFSINKYLIILNK